MAEEERETHSGGTSRYEPRSKQRYRIEKRGTKTTERSTISQKRIRKEPWQKLMQAREELYKNSRREQEKGNPPNRQSLRQRQKGWIGGALCER